jgi:hypothetical protein
MISIEVKNAKEISKMFADFGKEGVKALQGALYVTALEGASEAQKNCPVVTARLRSSIHAENQKTKITVYKDRNGLTYNGKLMVAFNEIDAAFGTNVSYAEPVNNRNEFMESGAAKAEDRIMENVVKAYNKLLENAKS